MRTMTVIPVKQFGRALGRLAGVLTRPERALLQAAMLTDLLSACRDCPQLSDLLVGTSDPSAADLARGHGAKVLPDHDPPRGMNPAVAIGQAHAAAAGIEAVLVLTADLPLTGPEDLAAIIAAAPAGSSAVLVPSHHGTGTNGLLIRPPGVIPTRLGPDSRALHLAEAAAAGVRLVELPRPGMALDIDTPDDLARLLAAPRPCTAQRVCRELGLGERLVAGIGS